MSERPVDTDAAVARVREAQADIGRTRTELRQAVKVALLLGVRAADLADVLGVTRARVYQIRDGRR